MKALAYLFIITGTASLFYSFVLLWQRNSPQRLSFSHYTETQTAPKKVLPARIIIEDLHIDLPVVPATISYDHWQTNDQGVSYLASSALPGKEGNSIFYGHNWTRLLGGLSKAKTGQKVAIMYTNGVKITFIINGIAIVTPDQTHILSNTQDTRLTLYTCTGFLDSKRLVITAVPAPESLTQL